MIELSNKVYNALKWISMILLPALASLYVGLADVWGLPFGKEVAATIMAIVVFLGLFLQINSAQYLIEQAFIKKEESVRIGIHAKFAMTNSQYDMLKWFATIFLPAASTLYVALSGVWNFPYTMEVSATISAFVLFLGALLQIASLRYRASIILATGIDNKENPAIKANVLSVSNKTYDLLKFITQGLLPGMSTLYVALAMIWNFPYAGQVSATIMAIVLFMNAILQISTAMYHVAVHAGSQ